MKAATYLSTGNLQLIDKPKPVIIKPTDAIVQLVKTTICGTDLHILGGDVPACKEGTILGHEGIGIVKEVGDAVTNFKIGDKVIISCVTSCHKCLYCWCRSSRTRSPTNRSIFLSSQYYYGRLISKSP